MPRSTKKRSVRRPHHAAARLFEAAFGRKMTSAELKHFIVEKPLTLQEVARRRRGMDIYGFLRQT